MSNLTVGQTRELGINFVEGDVRTSYVIAHGSVQMCMMLAKGTNNLEDDGARLNTEVLSCEVVSFAWRKNTGERPDVPEGFMFETKWFDEEVLTDDYPQHSFILDDDPDMNMRHWRPNLVQPILNKVPSESMKIALAELEGLDAIEEVKEEETPKPKLWTLVDQQNGVELEAGMIALCDESFEVEIKYHGKDLTVFVYTDVIGDDNGLESVAYSDKITPIDNRTPKQKKSDEILAFLSDNEGLASEDLVDKMYDNGMFSVDGV
jgi:hypothetical protein